jgi:hypothetical protein
MNSAVLIVVLLLIAVVVSFIYIIILRWVLGNFELFTHSDFDELSKIHAKFNTFWFIYVK